MNKVCMIMVCWLIVTLTACNTELGNMNIVKEDSYIRIAFTEGLVVGDSVTRASTAAGKAFKTSEYCNIYIKDVTNTNSPSVIGSSPNVMLAQLLYLRPNAEAISYNGFDAAGLKYPAGCTHIGIHAIWPTTVKDNITSSFAVNTDQISNDNLHNSDLMFADIERTPRSPYPILLNFKHKMARITVNITGTASSLLSSVSLANVYNTISVSPATSSVGSVTGSVTTVKMATTSASSSAVIPPQPIGTVNSFIVVTTRNSKTINFKLEQPVTLLSGMNYIYNLIINTADLASSTTEYTISADSSIDENATIYYGYTGTVQQFVVPEDGQYKL